MIIKIATQLGNPVIRRKSKPAKFSSTQTKKIIKDLVDSMRYHNLVGMAAPQIGHNARIFVIEVRATKFRKQLKANPLQIFINPIISFPTKKLISGYEGCGSVAAAGLFGKVPRHADVVVHATDQNGKRFTLKARGLLARIIQHEFDHLEGKVFLDRITDTKTLYSRSEYLKYIAK